jgi:phosphoribosyl 1,2-cyclic phosphodiesterase
MIEIQSIGSSSSGNCYRIQSRKSSLLLDCGLPIAKIKIALNFGLSAVAGCLVSHEHGDHAKAVPGLLKYGIGVYMSRGTAEGLALELNLGSRHHRLHIVKAGIQFQIGSWTVLPFETVHDCAEPLGFLISDGEGDKIIFATDTAYIRNTFSGLTAIMVECNYSLDVLQERMNIGDISKSRYDRIIQTHFGLDNVLEFLKANNLSKVKSIHLMHMSDDNINEARAVREVQRLTGLPVVACRK